MKSRPIYVTAYTLLAVLWGLLVIGARSLSLSMDEPLHIAAGYTFLARWQASSWYFPLNLPPPLLNACEGLLLFLTNPHIPLETLEGWGNDFIAYTDAFLPYMLPLERTEFLARTPMMLLVILLGALVFRWSKEVGNAKVGLLALIMLVFDPTLLAHGRLANTDTGTAAIGTAALYAAWRWSKQPTWTWAIATGILAGLTLLAKFSGVLYIAAMGIMALVVMLQQWRLKIMTRLGQAAVIGALAMLVVWAAFAFSFGPTPLAPFSLPAPAYWTAFYNQQGTAAQRIFIAFGKTWFGTQWWYFPLNALIKNPLPLLAVFLAGGWSFIKLGWRHPPTMAIIVFPLVYAAASIAMGMNVSYRHLYPIHPFLYLMAAKGLWDWLACRRQTAWLYLVGGALGSWYIAGTMTIFPNELTYFNELVGGPDGGYRYLVDYARDWGQSFKQLRDFVHEHPGPTPQVIYFTAVQPSHYGVEFRPILPSGGAQDWAAPFHPRAGRYVMGDGPLYGLIGTNPQQLDWFRRAHPTAIVGHSLFVYDVANSPAWLIQCTTPTSPLDSTAVASGFQVDMRQAHVDCTTTWLYPSSERQTGVYALDHELLAERSRCLSLLWCDPVPSDSFVARHLSTARLSYEQRYDSRLPAFVLYEMESPLLPTLQPGQAGPAGAIPAAIISSHIPIPLDGPLTFLGTASYRSKNELEVESWWQVTHNPITRPFSIMAHLVTRQGEELRVADGLGVSPLELVNGDIVVQRHRFNNLPDDKEIWLRTGAYWLDTLERWSVTNEPGSDAIFVQTE